MKKHKHNQRLIILIILLIFGAALALTFVRLSFSMRSVNAVSEREALKMLTRNAEQIKQVMENQIDKKLVSLDNFMSLLSIDLFGEDARIRIVDKSGADVLQPVGAEEEEKEENLFSQYEAAEFKSADGSLDFTDFREYVISGKSGAVHVIEPDGSGKILSFTKVGNLDWYVIVARDYDHVLGTQRENIKRITGTAQAAIFFTILFAVVVSVSLMVWNEKKMYQKNLELEEINAKLSAANASLGQAKEVSEQALKVAEAASRAKSFFLSNMSHDIRTPMNAVVGFASLLSRNAENPDKVREYTKKITFSSQHLLGIINDVLDMSKMESGRTILSLTEESVTDIIDEISGSIRPQVAAKEQTLKVEAKDIVHDMIIVDRVRIKQILMNLLSNAVKYTQEHGNIQLKVSELHSYGRIGYYRIIVSDNGYGMSEEFQKTIFEVFRWEEDSRISRTPGNDLGMAITKNLINLMGGSIKVDSRKGEGTSFTVDIQFQLAHSGKNERFLAENGIQSCLVVDADEVSSRETAALLAENTGIQVDSAQNGREAIEKLQFLKKYQVVLLDRRMPTMDGLETAKQIRTMLAEEAPIMLMTGCDSAEREALGLYGIVDGVVTEPFSLKKFQKVMEKILIPQKGYNREEAVEEGGILEGKHILAAEDNELNAELLTEFLEMAGATSDVCENGRLVVKTFEQSDPGMYDFILMDIQMPVMNGYEAARAIRSGSHPLARTIPIIAMTANAFTEDIKDALAAGMNAHIAKPLEMAVLEETVRKCLEGCEPRVL